MTIVRGDVYCVWDRVLGWSSPRKCRPCVVLASDGAGGVSVIPRTTHPIDPRSVIESPLENPPFDRDGWFVVIPVPIGEGELMDHKGSCPVRQLAAIVAATRP
jgi:hypothetical protein